MEGLNQDIKKINTRRTLKKRDQSRICIDCIDPVQPILESRTWNTGIFGKVPLTELFFTALEIDNFDGNIVSGSLGFEICFLRRFRVCNGHVRSVVPFFRIVFVGAISIPRPGYLCLPVFLINFIC